MTITWETATRNAFASSFSTLCDAGAAGAKLELRASTTVLATITLHTTSFGSPATGVITAIGGDDVNPISSGNPITFTGAASGNADNWRILDSNDTLIASGLVTATGGAGEVTLDNVSIANGQNGNLNSLALTMPATT